MHIMIDFICLPTRINSSGRTNDRTSTIDSSFPTSTTTIDNQINNNNLISTSPWLPHLPSKFKDKQTATTQHINIKKEIQIYLLIFYVTSKSTLTTQNQQILSTNRILTNNKNHMDDENLEQQQKQIITIDDILTQISNNIHHG
ncbi:unnamed protein product [Rotaria sp. Silwood2]|nr:unnamed protein product [Rotaria sp. Silwood2]